MSDNGLTYSDAGVDLDRAEAVKARLRELVESTRTEGAGGGYGSFGGRFRLGGAEELVASADGVGTKVKVAVRAGRHDTVGEDLVNHSVNDVLTEGAEPLFFLDYFASGSLEGGVGVSVVEGVARGCRRNGCALLGGETAEMPDIYAPGEYDLAGFLVGRVAFPEVSERDLRAGDRLLALASSGIHTNGFTFARRALFDRRGLGVEDPWPDQESEPGASVGDVLLRVHRSYLEYLGEPCRGGRIRALAHVTGGGIAGNLRRVLPEGLDAAVDLGGCPPPPVFQVLRDAGDASWEEMYRVFNMGIGMIAATRPGDAGEVAREIRAAGCPVEPCGELVDGEGRVRLSGLP
jgi:phosphoribosylformylglycinamidine cyclo-ligase